MSKQIQLTNSAKKAVVDDCMFEYLSQFTWKLIQRPQTAHAVAYSGNKTFYMHQLVLPSDDPDYTPDHKDGDGLNNQLDNLRLATKEQQSQNTKKRNMTCSSKFKGVCFSKRENKWKGYIDINGQRKHLGTFNFEISAAKAYNRAALANFGEFAVINKFTKVA